ncbi:hypothetical protein [Streptomyces sp. NBC_01618]
MPLRITRTGPLVFHQRFLRPLGALTALLGTLPDVLELAFPIWGSNQEA